MFFFTQHIRHILRSNSRHGTHSPFVYALADQAVYKPVVAVEKEVQNLDAVPLHYRNVLSRVLRYLNKEKICDIEGELCAGDVLLIKAEKLSKSIINKYLDEQTILVVDGIYRRKRAQYAWKRAQLEGQVTISIDFFHFGLLITRPGQVKEHFMLRYPFWMR